MGDVRQERIKNRAGRYKGQLLRVSRALERADHADGFTTSKAPLMNPTVQQRAYLIPYARLRELLGFETGDEQPVLLHAEKLQQAVRMLLRGVYVDEDWYSSQYPDVRDAIAKGVFRSGKHHFIESGYFEGRRPARVVVDENWYSRAYPDVGESVEFGEIGSCQEHFDRYGEREGRLPAQD